MARELPPGQHAIDGFPRFGTHLHRPPPPVPEDAAIEVAGAVRERFSIPVGQLATLPRRRLTADFHCAAGWTATDLEWEGVDFDTFYGLIIEPSLQPGPPITHLSFVGLDGFRSIVAIEDAIGGDLLIADRLGGRPIEPDHGAPVRLVSPRQYGYKSTKHLCRVELHTSAPKLTFPHLDPFSRAMLRSPLFGAHPRARVWEEERHPYVPARPLRPLYFWLLRPPLRFLSGLGSQKRRDARG
jgi:DMSO/TMAO reductase YedYZ molybdopterin-dependent catalytic subunit